MVAFFFGLVADLKLSLISKPNITSIAEPIETEFEMALRCPIPARRLLPLTALAAGACPATNTVAADEDRPGCDERPQKGDLLVISEGGHAGEIIGLDDLKLGGQPLQAWPKDPKFLVVPTVRSRSLQHSLER
jgi:hypothetical protein